LARAYSPADYLLSRELEREPTRHVSTLEIFGPAKSVVCVTDFPPCVEDVGQSIDIVAVGKKISFAPSALPALEMLLSGAPVEVAEVGAKTGLEADQLAKVLVEQEICAELTPELSSGYTGLVTTGVSSRRLSLSASAR
jgi:hypothetical protein